MAVSNNLIDKNGRYEIGFFGTPLSTNSLNVIVPYTNAGGTVLSTLPNNYGAVSGTWSTNSGGWINWNPIESIIPSNSTVEYAFLVWSTAYYPMITPAQETLANTLPITLRKPDGTTHSVTPQPINNLMFNGGWRQFTHGAEVTNIMLDNQYGNYKLTGVPTGSTGGSGGLGGWGLYILYTNPVFPYRNANLNVTATGFNEVVTISNLITPVTGPVNVKVYLSSVQGDAGYADSLLLNGTKLSGPFNPINDFMNDKYVDYTGLALQTIGSLMPQTGSQYAYYADQTMVSNNTILKNGDSTVILKQDNAGDWAGVSFLGVLTDLNSATLNPLEKSVDKSYAKPGDNLIYTLVYKNIGSVPAINVKLLDTLPVGLTFVNNSILINGAAYSGDVTAGVTLPDIAVGELVTINFTANVGSNVASNTLFTNKAAIDYDFTPDGTTLVNSVNETNLVFTTIVDAKMNVQKMVDKLYAGIGETITYTVVIQNQSIYELTNIVFKDTIPSNGSLVTNSLNQDGTIVSYNSGGVTLPKIILPNNVSTVTYKITASSTVPDNPILNSATIIAAASIANGGTINLPLSENTGNVSTEIKYMNMSINKLVDKTFATNGEIITYTLVINNTGNIDGKNLLVKDTIPSGTSFIANSVTVDGATVSGADIELGVNVGTIAQGTVTTLTFQVLVL